MSQALRTVRAFAVVFGGPLVLDLGAVASFWALQRGSRPRWAIAGALLAVLYAIPGRRWMRSRTFVDIDAPPEAVWPWLAQMGQDRGGFYSIEWLENLAGCRMRNADTIHPEWQHRDVGETVMLHPDTTGMPVTRFEPNRAYGLEGWGTFVLEPLPGGRTRLAEQPAEAPWASRVFYAALVQIPHFVMQQAMFRGIKCRAERTRNRGPGPLLRQSGRNRGPGPLLRQSGPERRSSSSSAAAWAAASSATRSLAS